MCILTLMAQGFMELIPYQPFTVCVSIFGDKLVSLPKHSPFGIALPSSVHVLTISPASPEWPELGKTDEGESGEDSSADSAKT